MTKLKLTFLLVAIVISHSGFSQFNVFSGQTAQQLVLNLTGTGLTTYNVSGQFNSNAAGNFVSNGVQGFPFTTGIIMATGLVLTTNVNFPASVFNSTDFFLPGDSTLDNMSVFATQDAAVLEFDFQALTDSVELDVVFASEDYNSFVNSIVCDIFGFFVTGPGYNPNTNVALLPGTTSQIYVNTVNNGQSNVTSSGPCTNCNYFIDNVNTGAVDLVYNGFTTAIKIKFPVWPCSNYHFKIAIADVSDGSYDSAIMLEENSFVPCQNLQGFVNGAAVSGPVTICNGGSATLTAPDGAQYTWSTGDSTQSIIVNQPGSYSFMITDPASSNCFAFSNTITVIQSGNIQTPVINQNGTFLEAPNIVPSIGMTYQWYLNGVEISGATLSTYTFTANGCYTLTIYESNCESTSNVVCVTNTSLYELQSGAINIYPHPVTSTSIIETPFKEGSVTSIKLKDIGGREVYSASEMQGRHLKLEKGSLRSGIYLLEISNSDYQGTVIRKVVLQ